ncbi:YAR1 [Symbiodinium natans]|uniref:YAR1 protein n=1 Tax=Symbiodinium natans TaxID=878477 RepID=A0A812KY45_9DINO|nr:YAR1 [Symbiodinium natans]
MPILTEIRAPSAPPLRPQAVDAQNGNLALHISAQNGHMGLTSFLLESRRLAAIRELAYRPLGANVNAQNFNGQTALHMSVEYDMYFQTKLLLDAKADPNLENSGGHKALTGLEGAKTGTDAWDNPMNILKAASDTEEELKLAFEALAAADAKDLDRVVLAQTGMRKRKQCPQHWNADRFKEIMQKF